MGGGWWSVGVRGAVVGGWGEGGGGRVGGGRGWAGVKWWVVFSRDVVISREHFGARWCVDMCSVCRILLI